MPGAVAAAVQRLTPVRKKPEVVKELVSALTSPGCGLLRETIEKMQGAPGCFSRTWNCIRLTEVALRMLQGATANLPSAAHAVTSNAPVLLPVPASLRSAEEARTRETQTAIRDLQAQGVDTSTIPAAELETLGAQGPTVQMHLQWAQHVASRRARGREEEARELEEVLALILRWRNERAMQLGMAPAGVMGEHVAKRIVHSGAYSAEGLRQAGVRIVGMDALSGAISDLLARQAARRPLPLKTATETGCAIAFPDGLWRPRPYAFCPIVKPAASGKRPVWGEGAERFGRGETMASIAMSPPSGRGSVQISTVANYLLTSLLHGYALDMGRFTRELQQSEGDNAKMTTGEIADFELAAQALKIDFTADFMKGLQTKEMIRMLPGVDIIVGLDVDYALRSRQQQDAYGALCLRINIWKHLRAAGFWADAITITSSGNDNSANKRSRLV